MVSLDPFSSGRPRLFVHRAAVRGRDRLGDGRRRRGRLRDLVVARAVTGGPRANAEAESGQMGAPKPRR